MVPSPPPSSDPPGLRIVVVTVVSWWLACYPLGLLSPTLAYEEHAGLMSVVLLLSLLLSIYLYLSGRRRGHHGSGALAQDWWMGVELNPSLFGLDLKLFALKPAMLGWLMLNLSCAAEQVRREGALSLGMAVYQVLAATYVLDYFWFEPMMLSTWDIIAENWGFMLVFGDLWWIPLAFSAQAFYLVAAPPAPLSYHLAALLCFLLGFAIFRQSNLQKDAFKRDPSVPIWGRVPEALGGRLLVAGWWGVLRKPNYLGDLLIALAFSLPCGSPWSATSYWPWLYPAYLLVLLLHRQQRDDHKCALKYGPLWTAYTERVPYALFPGIY